MELWTEKYRPKIRKDYVFRDINQKLQIDSWVKEGALPHLQLSGSPGVGKTTLALVLLNELKVQEGDILKINASHENNVDTVRHKITGFVSTMAWGDFKYVLLDEFDMMTTAAQSILRNLIETYQESARFILTCNNPNKIIPALHSRCQGFHIEKLDEEEFLSRIVYILDNENVEYKPEDLVSYVKATYPDLRKCINTVQQNVCHYKLTSPKGDETNTIEYMVNAVALFQNGEIRKARELICKNIRQDEYDDFYRLLYRNLSWWGNTLEKQDEAILVIRNGLVKHTMVADQEINLAATLCELDMIRKK